MENKGKTRGQLPQELTRLRQRIAELEAQETERKQMEEALREREERLSQIIQGSSIATHVIDNNHVITHCNKAFENLTGIPRDKLIGTKKQWAPFYPKERPVMSDLIADNVPEEEILKYYGDKCQKSALIDGAYELEDFFPHIGKRGRWLFTTVAPLRGIKGKVIGAIVTVQDITERVRAEEELTKHREHLEELVSERTSQLEEKTIELEQANERLKELDHLKSMFLASMSHELRTPLNSIIGFTGILLQGISGALSDEQKKQLAMVKGSGQHLLDLINDLLDVSKIEAGKVEVFPEEFALADVANEVTAAFSPAADKKKLDVVTELQDEIVLLRDRRRIKQVLMNLVSNAVKFTDQGEVTITGKRLDNDQVEFEVTDTGIGMKQEDIQRLFQPFQQIDESLTKEHRGTGLGLYLCKKIVDLLHGEIRVESEYGTGTTFTVTLPLQHESETRGDE